MKNEDLEKLGIEIMDKFNLIKIHGYPEKTNKITVINGKQITAMELSEFFINFCKRNKIK